jgi:hypothetical protein
MSRVTDIPQARDSASRLWMTCFGGRGFQRIDRLMTYPEIRAVLSPAERRLFARLTTPHKIQDFLDRMPINFEVGGETYMSPRRVIKARTAHCFEGALFAAVALAYHRQPPLLMDLRTTKEVDHVIALFRVDGLWGAISKTNHAILRFRDPIYRSPRELAMSFFHEYIENDGHKSLRAYSRPFDLSRIAPTRWVTATEDLDWLVDALDDWHHFPIAPKKHLRRLRGAGATELRAMKIVEWRKPKGAAAEAALTKRRGG